MRKRSNETADELQLNQPTCKFIVVPSEMHREMRSVEVDEAQRHTAQSIASQKDIAQTRHEPHAIGQPSQLVVVQIEELQRSQLRNLARNVVQFIPTQIEHD